MLTIFICASLSWAFCHLQLIKSQIINISNFSTEIALMAKKNKYNSVVNWEFREGQNLHKISLKSPISSLNLMWILHYFPNYFGFHTNKKECPPSSNKKWYFIKVQHFFPVTLFTLFWNWLMTLRELELVTGIAWRGCRSRECWVQCKGWIWRTRAGCESWLYTCQVTLRKFQFPHQKTGLHIFSLSHS